VWDVFEIFFWPNEIAIGVDTLTYVDIGPDSDAGSNLTRPEKISNTSHTLLLHRDAATAIDRKGELTPFRPRR